MTDERESFPSGDDRRVEASSVPLPEGADNNIMRHAYRPLDRTEVAQMENIKNAGLSLWTLLNSLGTSRELSLAKTKVEEAVMWGTKHVTR